MNRQSDPVFVKHVTVVKNKNICGLHLNLKYFKICSGLIKILQLICGAICEWILLEFGLKYASILGFSYDAFLSTVSASITTTFILVITYIFSENSMILIRSSLFEILYNGFICMSYLNSSCWLVVSIQTFLLPQFLIVPFFIIYPLMILVNILGLSLAILYGIDCFLAYKHFSLRTIRYV